MKELRYLLMTVSLAGFLFSCVNRSHENDTSRVAATDSTLLIAYNVLVDGQEDDYDIFVMDLYGEGKTNITRHPDVAWTYLGVADRIFFISDRDTCHRCYFLYSMDAGGGDVRRICDYRLRDSWMSSRKNGQELIVNPHPSLDSAFYILDGSGQLIRKVYHGLAYGNDPCFSPDGKRIVFRGAQMRSKRDAGFTDELYIMNDDGSGLMQLTHYPSGDTTAPWYAYKAGPPRWNTREDFITYQSSQNGKYSLFAVTPDGKKQWKLTDLDYNEGWHDWSPDGKWLAIELFDDAQTQFHIGILNRETKEFKLLTDTTYKYQQAPVFVRKYPLTPS